ncbi:uncharacterized protein LOC104864781 [Fukomys damarensis]|uniref:uncharacterized protein LOC104864781 n=1 Tax=Fukomys damarensis TaxID=885580 RepID=UPI0008FECF10|nr:uncharacterized protein LOC104864781 [Fukomys damarensis]
MLNLKAKEPRRPISRQRSLQRSGATAERSDSSPWSALKSASCSSFSQIQPRLSHPFARVPLPSPCRAEQRCLTGRHPYQSWQGEGSESPLRLRGGRDTLQSSLRALVSNGTRRAFYQILLFIRGGMGEEDAVNLHNITLPSLDQQGSPARCASPGEKGRLCAKWSQAGTGSRRCVTHLDVEAKKVELGGAEMRVSSAPAGGGWGSPWAFIKGYETFG